jgi:hypothetical protein
MKTYIDLLLIAAITIYIVDLSGFTESWRAALARWLKAKELKALKPFDCGQCMTWWVGIIYSLCVGEFSLPILAYIAALAFLSFPIGQMMIFIREGMLSLVNKMMKLYD